MSSPLESHKTRMNLLLPSYLWVFFVLLFDAWTIYVLWQYRLWSLVVETEIVYKVKMGQISKSTFCQTVTIHNYQKIPS